MFFSMKVPRERIVAAAIKCSVGEIHSLPSPYRHEDIRLLMLYKGINRVDCTEGFITDARRFVTRRQASWEGLIAV
jgi:hypothetical protein